MSPHNGDEIEQLLAYSYHIYSFLLLSLKGEAKSFLVRYPGRPGEDERSDGQAAWNSMVVKYLDFSMHRRHL